MEKLVINRIWKGLVLLAISLAIVNAYLEWFEDRGNGILLAITLLIIIIAHSIRSSIHNQNPDTKYEKE